MQLLHGELAPIRMPSSSRTTLLTRGVTSLLLFAPALRRVHYSHMLYVLLMCHSQSATVTTTAIFHKIDVTKWVQNPLGRSDFSAVTAIFPRKVTDAPKKSLTVRPSNNYIALMCQ